MAPPPGREGRSRVAWCSGCRHRRYGCGGHGRTAALKPRPAHRWPVRATDVHDVIQRTSGEGKLVVRGGGHRASHQKSPVAMATARGGPRPSSSPPFLSPAAWLGSGIPRSAAVERRREVEGASGFSAKANLTRTGRSPRASSVLALVPLSWLNWGGEVLPGLREIPRGRSRRNLHFHRDIP